MPQSEARAWWADVQDVRETIERRRAAEQAAPTHAPGRRAAGAAAGDRERQRSRPAHAQHAVARPVRRSGSGARRAHGAPRRPLHLPGPQPAATDRRTVEITGRTVPAPGVSAGRVTDPAGAPQPAFPLRGAGRRPSLSAAERLAHRPDRIAAWAAVLGLALMVVAAL